MRPLRILQPFTPVLAFVALIAPLHHDAAAQEGLAAGSMVIASGEGVSVFDRAGRMTFGKFVNEVKDGVPTAPVWGDIVYDAHRLANGNYLVSAHEWVRELAPDGSLVWDTGCKSRSN